MGWLIAVGVIAGIALALFALDRLGLWMERKGWVYWRKVKPKETMHSGMSALQQFVEPEIKHVIQEKDQRRAAIDDMKASDD